MTYSIYVSSKITTVEKGTQSPKMTTQRKKAMIKTQISISFTIRLTHKFELRCVETLNVPFAHTGNIQHFLHSHLELFSVFYTHTWNYSAFPTHTLGIIQRCLHSHLELFSVFYTHTWNY